MIELVQLIKEIAIGAVENSSPCGVFFGRVCKNGRIKLQQRLTLKPQQIITNNFELVNESIAILLRVQGGQKYVVIGVLEDGRGEKI